MRVRSSLRSPHPGPSPIGEGCAPSIRFLLALRNAGLAQAFVDALKLRVEGRIVGPVPLKKVAG